jgi:hypothetical protein
LKKFLITILRTLLVEKKELLEVCDSLGGSPVEDYYPEIA